MVVIYVLLILETCLILAYVIARIAENIEDKRFLKTQPRYKIYFKSCFTYWEDDSLSVKNNHACIVAEWDSRYGQSIADLGEIKASAVCFEQRNFAKIEIFKTFYILKFITYEREGCIFDIPCDGRFVRESKHYTYKF